MHQGSLLRTLCGLGLVMAWAVACSPDAGTGTGAGGTAGVDGEATAAGQVDDPNSAWGVIELPSPSPGDVNPLQLALDGVNLVLTLNLSGVTAPRNATYVVHRLDPVLPPSVLALVQTPPPDVIHLENDVVEDHFRVKINDKRFYPGDYEATAYGDGSPTALGTRRFHVSNNSPAPGGAVDESPSPTPSGSPSPSASP